MARQRLTEKNIREQAENAPPGTIVHGCTPKGTCPRKIAKTDAYGPGTYPYDPKNPWRSLGTTAEATHIENITCLYCRKEYFRMRREFYAEMKSQKAAEKSQQK